MNIRPTTEIDLAGHNFVITHWSPQGYENLPKIGRYVAVPMATISGSMMTGARIFLMPAYSYSIPLNRWSKMISKNFSH